MPAAERFLRDFDKREDKHKMKNNMSEIKFGNEDESDELGEEKEEADPFFAQTFPRAPTSKGGRERQENSRK